MTFEEPPFDLHPLDSPRRPSAWRIVGLILAASIAPVVAVGILFLINGGL